MWRELLEKGSVEWGDILNKPILFPPSQHVHQEYLEDNFSYGGNSYDYQDVVSQIVSYLEKNFSFKLS